MTETAQTLSPWPGRIRNALRVAGLCACCAVLVGLMARRDRLVPPSRPAALPLAASLGLAPTAPAPTPAPAQTAAQTSVRPAARTLDLERADTGPQRSPGRDGLAARVARTPSPAEHRSPVTLSKQPLRRRGTGLQRRIPGLAAHGVQPETVAPLPREKTPVRTEPAPPTLGTDSVADAAAEAVRRMEADEQRKATDAQAEDDDPSPAPTTTKPEPAATTTAAAQEPETNNEEARTTETETQPAAAPVDWTQEEITGPVPRANLVVYGKHGILMLRSHAAQVRVYRNVTMPPSLPAGTCKIAEKREGERPALVLGYPRVDDAEAALREKRIDTETRDRIVAAWQAGQMPPNDTPLGQVVLQPRGEGTGGIRLDPRDFDELRTAVRAGTPVMFVE